MSATKQSDELKEGDEVVLRGKVDFVDPSGKVHLSATENGKTVYYTIPASAHLRKVHPGTYEVTTRELVKIMSRLFRYKELSSLVVQNKGRLNKKDQRRLRHFFRARLKELKRKRKV